MTTNTVPIQVRLACTVRKAKVQVLGQKADFAKYAAAINTEQNSRNTACSNGNCSSSPTRISYLVLNRSRRCLKGILPLRRRYLGSGKRGDVARE